MTCLDGDNWLLFNCQQMEPQCSPLLLKGAGPGKPPKSLNFRNDSSEHVSLALPMNHFRAFYYWHQKLALVNLN